MYVEFYVSPNVAYKSQMYKSQGPPVYFLFIPCVSDVKTTYSFPLSCLHDKN